MLVAIHWLTALSILGALALIFGREFVDAKALRLILLDSHRTLGLVVLLAALVRVALRIFHYPLPELASMSKAQKLGAATVHFLLYGLLFSMPVLGWCLSGARGQVVRFLGLFPLPSLVQRDADLAEALADYHEWAAWALIAIVGLHILAALWHHFIRRDAVLVSMLPLRAARSLSGSSQ